MSRGGTNKRCVQMADVDAPIAPQTKKSRVESEGCQPDPAATLITATSRLEPRDWDKWVSASATRNYLINDPLLDYLAKYHYRISSLKKEYISTISKAINRRSGGFVEFIMEKGKEFEMEVMALLHRKLPQGVIVNIGGNSTNVRDEAKVKETMAAMNKGVPIIYSGVLHDEELEVYGIPDLLVRSDWFNDLVGTNPISKEDSKISAPLLGNPLRPGKPAGYHYRVVDIKFSTIPLRADGVRILNAGSFPAYKGQLWIYTTALGKMQGYEPPQAYILGRRWMYTSKGEKHRGYSCLEKLGVIDYADVDHEYIERTLKAVSWLRDLRENGDKWDIFARPAVRQELCPNMCNSHDYPWTEVKGVIAQETGEHTLLWMVGPHNRDLAHQQGVYKWTDPRCTPKVLGVNGAHTSKILQAILDINRNTQGKLIRPDVVANDDYDWQTQQPIEFYVDFEYLNDVFSDFAKMPVSEAKSLIFMIGVRSRVRPKKGTDPFSPPSSSTTRKTFKVSQLTFQEEKRICSEFSDYIRSESKAYKLKNPLMIHWSNAENWQWANAYDRHDGLERAWIPSSEDNDGRVDPRWFDLLKVFRSEPIVVKDALGFGLKAVAGALYKHGLIKTTWDKSSGCSDGTAAMMTAYYASKEAARLGVPLTDIPAYRDIEKYNEVDCAVLEEIVTLLRSRKSA